VQQNQALPPARYQQTVLWNCDASAYLWCMEERNGLSRLTEREKECLRLWLQHKTAKEIALDLGISHHAVEKRLKMARIKLDAGSSLEAARMLGEAEGYGLTVAHSPEVESEAPTPDKWFTRPLALGVMTMILLATATAFLLSQASTVEATATDNSDVPEILMVMATPEQIEDHIAEQFAEFDADGSGFIEESEGPRSIGAACCNMAPRDELTGQAAWQFFIDQNEDDGDNRISHAEFRNVRYDAMLKNGFAVNRADVIVIGERNPPYAANPGNGEQREFLPTDFETTPATEERARAYVRTMFDATDRDRSGFVELAEAPEMLGTPKATLRADGTLVYDRNDPLNRLSGDDARAQYMENADRDGDGRISFEEYSTPIIPHYVENGIPLVPADWTQMSPGANREG